MGSKKKGLACVILAIEKGQGSRMVGRDHWHHWSEAFMQQYDPEGGLGMFVDVRLHRRKVSRCYSFVLRPG